MVLIRISILFSDEDEVWYFESGSGHHWVAQRIPDDCYAVVANQLAIQKVDLDDPDNFMYSKGIVQILYTKIILKLILIILTSVIFLVHMNIAMKSIVLLVCGTVKNTFLAIMIKIQ